MNSDPALDDTRVEGETVRETVGDGPCLNCGNPAAGYSRLEDAAIITWRKCSNKRCYLYRDAPPLRKTRAHW